MSLRTKANVDFPAYNKETSVFLQRTEHNVLDQDKVLAKEQGEESEVSLPSKCCSRWEQPFHRVEGHPSISLLPQLLLVTQDILGTAWGLRRGRDPFAPARPSLV